MIAMARLRFALLVAVLLVAGHDATYAIANGIGGLSAALRDTGHDGYWTPTVLLVVALAAAGAAAELWRRGRLRRELRRLGARRPSIHARELISPPTLFLATRLAAGALVVFVAQENVEHYSAHGGHLPGLGVLAGHGYGSTLPVFVALAVLIAFVARYVAADTAALVEAISAARSLPRSVPSSIIRRPAWVNLPRSSSVTARPDLGRAPPVLLTT